MQPIFYFFIRKISIYTDSYIGKKIKITRKIFEINNGAAGAPYYSKQETPWNKIAGYLRSFSVQNALVLIHVHGKKLGMQVVNPKTFGSIDHM